MQSEEQKLALNDSKYRSYVNVMDKALRAFESTNEWADLISALAKVIKATQLSIFFELTKTCFLYVAVLHSTSHDKLRCQCIRFMFLNGFYCFCYR